MSWPARPIKLGSSIAVVGLYAGLLSLIIRNNKERSVSWPSCSYDANNDDDAWFFAWETAGYLERCGESGQQTCRTTSDFGLELIFRAPNRLRSDLLCIGAWQSFPIRSNRFKEASVASFYITAVPTIAGVSSSSTTTSTSIICRHLGPKTDN